MQRLLHIRIDQDLLETAERLEEQAQHLRRNGKTEKARKAYDFAVYLRQLAKNTI